MATRVGSDSTFVGSNSGGVFDASGNDIVSADTGFGGSPLGIAARSQALYFLANPSFNLLPPNPSASIVDNQNPLPYWSVDNLSDGKIAATVQYDTTTQTWALRLDPTTAVSGDSMVVKTRSYLLNDTNFSLRQKALANLEKVGTYSGSSQFSLSLAAEYFDAVGNSLSSYAIGTVADNTTWTSISGITTSGSAAVSAAAQYVDLTFTLSATATVTSGVKVDINSLLLQTSTTATGSLLIAQTYTAGTTWTRPTGVDYLVAVVGCGGGGGGASGQIAAGSTTANNSVGSGGGGGATWFIAKDVYVGGTANATISVGIGAAGAGGSATVFTKAVASTTQAAFTRVAGGAGGASTFGSFFSAPGGNGATTAKEGGAASSASTTIIYGAGSAIGAAGGVGGNNSTTPGSSGGVGGLSPYTVIPYSIPSAGSAGSAASGTGGTRVTGTATAGGTAGIIGGGGAGGYSAAGAASALTANATGTNGGGGAGANLSVYISTAGTVTALGGDGGAAGSASGSGGGSGGAVNIATSTAANWTNSNISITSGKGGDGSVGFVTLVYVA